jgi:hypothetical protein
MCGDIGRGDSGRSTRVLISDTRFSRCFGAFLANARRRRNVQRHRHRGIHFASREYMDWGIVERNASLA